MNPVQGVLHKIQQRVSHSRGTMPEATPDGASPAEKRDASLALARELFHSVEQFVISTPDLDTSRFLKRMRATTAAITSNAQPDDLRLYREWVRKALGTFAALQRRCVAEREEEMWRLLDALSSASEAGIHSDQRLVHSLRESYQRLREYASIKDIREARLHLEDEIRRIQKVVELKAREDRERIAALQRQVTRLEAALAAVRGQADFDVLTGVYHRGVFDQRLQEMLSANGPCSLAMIDVDNFKTINDTLGHTVGDRILTMVGGNIHRVARSSDVPARYGGDEFAFACLGFTAEQLAQRLSGAVARRHVRLEMDEGERVVQVLLSTSVGIAAAREGDSPSTLLQRADQALLAAKQAGKGGTRIAL